jgi:hypothetical protein
MDMRTAVQMKWRRKPWSGRRTRMRVLPTLILVLAVSACASNQGENRGDSVENEEVPEPTSATIQEVQEAHTPEWMQLAGVVGTGIGLCNGEPCIRIFLSRPSPETEAAIGERVEGHRIDFVVTGDFTPRPPPDSASPRLESSGTPEPN